ncbi:MAG: pilus assembly protein TadG-related protein [Myxococcota bacterium]
MKNNRLFSTAGSLSRNRRGNYAVILTLSLIIPLGFGALALDTSYIRLTQTQAQDVADAASQSALFMLRRTGDQALAEEAAQVVVDRNEIGDDVGDMKDIDFGTWNYDTDSFSPTTFSPNAVEVTVARENSNSLDLLLSKTMGYTTFEVERSAVSSTRDLQVILVIDITGSWGEADFAYARDASLVFWDVLSQSYSDFDQLGMTIFTNRYSWAYTDMPYIVDVANTTQIDDNWSVLNIASKGGTDANPYDGKGCKLKDKAERNDFTSPAGGCYPDMPREYTDEPGTDHTTGITQAFGMFNDNFNNAAYRAMIVLTDGRPANVKTPTDITDPTKSKRAADGYKEDRWPQYVGPVPHNAGDIRTDSIALTQQMWDDLRVNTWVVSFVANETFMESMPHGDGYYVRTTDPSEIIDIFEDIANSLPLAIVR